MRRPATANAKPSLIPMTMPGSPPAAAFVEPPAGVGYTAATLRSMDGGIR